MKTKTGARVGFVKKEGFLWGHRTLVKVTQFMYENRYQKALERFSRRKRTDKLAETNIELYQKHFKSEGEKDNDSKD